MARDISMKISQILWGRSFVDVEDGSEATHTLVLRSLSIRENNYLNFLYEKELDRSMQSGILTQDQLRRLFYAYGAWGDEENEKRENLKKELTILSNQLKRSEFHTLKKKKIKKRIEQIEREINELNQQELTLFSVSAENRSEEIKRRFMVQMFTETIEEKPLWSNREEFLNIDDVQFVNNLVVAYYKNNIYSEKELREIARSPEWRFRWVAAKHGEQLFGRPISEWSEMQNMLVYWSEYYDGIYESTDRPPEYIIEDDVLCDQWVKNQNKKLAQNKNHPQKQKRGQKLDHNEQFIMVAKDDKEAIEKVQSMNSDQVREQLRKEFEQIRGSKNRIKEWDLGDRKRLIPTKSKRRG